MIPLDSLFSYASLPIAQADGGFSVAGNAIQISWFVFLGLSFLVLMIFRWGEGLWSNFIITCNWILSAIFGLLGGLALAAFIATQAVEMSPSKARTIFMITYFTVWGCMLLSLIIMNLFTKSVSQVRVGYPKVFEMIFNGFTLLSLWLVNVIVFVVSIAGSLIWTGALLEKATGG